MSKYFYFQLADRIVHAFFQDGHDPNANEYTLVEKMQFLDFVRVLAHFRPLKRERHVHRNKLNSRKDKLKCKFVYQIEGRARSNIINIRCYSPSIWIAR